MIKHCSVHHLITFDNNLFYGTLSGKSLECLQRHFITHTHTHYKYTHYWSQTGRFRRKKMTDQYAEEKRCVFQF